MWFFFASSFFSGEQAKISFSFYMKYKKNVTFLKHFYELFLVEVSGLPHDFFRVNPLSHPTVLNFKSPFRFGRVLYSNPKILSDTFQSLPKKDEHFFNQMILPMSDALLRLMNGITQIVGIKARFFQIR